MGFGKFLKKALKAPLKVAKKSAQLAHKATTAPAKKFGILPTKKPTTKSAKPLDVGSEVKKTETSEKKGALGVAVKKAQKTQMKRKSLGGFKSL